MGFTGKICSFINGAYFVQGSEVGLSFIFTKRRLILYHIENPAPCSLNNTELEVEIFSSPSATTTLLSHQA